jgi:hypothetical protein
MPTWIQHAVVIVLASLCAIVFVLRRVRALRGDAPLCDGCAGGQSCGGKQDPKRACASDAPIPVSALVRRRT